jgi:hypothetical protein
VIINVPSQPPDGQLQKRRIRRYLILWLNTAISLPTSGEGEIFRTRPDRPWGPPSLLYNENRVLPRVKAAGAWRWPLTPSSTEVKERVELYIYSPSGPSWPVLGWTLPVPLPRSKHNVTVIKTSQHCIGNNQFVLRSTQNTMWEERSICECY